ncbi:MAG: methionine synthase [Deltaproteobacteria bacterium]|nr:methionine synthase [Deltaproteobacteria bacterium]
MSGKSFHFNFLATGIGSVPFQDIEATCRVILKYFPLMPFWPQLVRRSYLEDMSAQYCEGLPLLEINEEQRSLTISSGSDVEAELTTFYEHFLAQDVDYFSISKGYAPGLYAMLDLMGQDAVRSGPYIKGQTVGPVTFAAGILDLNGKPILHNAELLEAMVNGLAIKALWQVRELGKSGRSPIIFLDEPYLSGFGSAFSPIQRHEVIDILRTVIDYLRENSDTLVGIHCCGNTDWPIIVEASPDIINFDAFEYMEHFLLYPDDIARFLKGGGSIAWGIIPTSGFTGKETAEGLFSKIEEGLHRVYEWGIAPEMLAERSILTPACGMGTMDPAAAKKGMELLSRLSQKWEETSAA